MMCIDVPDDAVLQILINGKISGILALIQLLLIFIVFRRGTPNQLYQEKLEDKAMDELVRIYPILRRQLEADC